tara:strand:- start:127 stop:435 length:309 start_codon:yes stop_codon:yes gene_type:complete
MNSEIGAKTLTSTGTIQSGRTRLLSIYYVGHASAGTLTFKDGGNTGTQKLVITTPAGSAADQYQINMPLDGMLFKTDMHLTISNVTSVTVFVTPITADTDNG